MKLSRRRFLRRTAACSVGLGAPLLVPSHVLAGPGRRGANDKIGIGYIGVGGMGLAQLKGLKNNPGARTVAVCDCDQNHLARAVQAAGNNPARYTDFRSLLENDDVDAVLIASPDHWHAVQTILACQAGKDVYCQKPACNTLAEGKAMLESARRYARVVQIGSQGRSHPISRVAGNFIRNGALGKITKVSCWHPMNPDRPAKPDRDPPPELDWDLWLGPARWRPYNADRCHFWFRYFLDLGGGNIRDRGAHVMSLVLWFMNADQAGPISVEATGAAPKLGLFDCPTTMDVRYEFTNPNWTLEWSQPGRKESQADFGAKYWGDRGTLVVDGGDGHCDTEQKAKDFKVPARGADLPSSPGHEQNWLDCIRTREQPIMPLETGVRVATLTLLGNIAYRLGRKLRWDPANERFIADDQANLLLHQPPRAPWQI